MLRVQASTHVARPADEVFAFVALGFFEHYRKWSPEVVSVVQTSPGPLRVGTTGRQVRVDFGRRTEATFRVSALEAGRRIEFQGISTPFHVAYWFAGQPAGTQLGFRFELARLELYLRPFEGLIRRVADEGALRVVGNIKALVEARAPKVGG